MNKQEYLELQSIYEREGQSTSCNIANVLIGNNHIEKCALIATAYVLLLANDDGAVLSDVPSFCASANLGDDREAFLASSLTDYWQMVVALRNRYSPNVLKSIILFYEDRDYRFGCECKTPESIISLSDRLFGFDKDEEIADFGIGSAAFITEMYLRHQNLSFAGLEINATAKEIAAIKLEVLGCSISLEQSNIFDIDPDSHKYQNIFANYPFGLRLRELVFDKNRLIQRITEKTSDLSKSVSSDWLFNAAIMECLKENGKAICIMTNGSTWNTMDRTARKYFIENGYLQAIIALPERMFDNTNIPTTMAILSFNNSKTMLVDATSLCEKGRRSNTFTKEQIEKIVFATTNESEYSHLATKQELQDNEYVINPTRYLTEEVVVENGVPFSTYIKSITRGAPIKANELDEMVSNEPTDYQYLMLANIQRGQIDSDLPYLKGIDDNLRKYCLKNHSLILSKNGAPFKIAVAEVEDGKTILANGNLYIIEIDEEKTDPYYIKAFLESEKGIALLKSITVGATIPNIGVESLKKIKIPNIPLNKQKEIVDIYRAKLDEIAICQKKLKKLYGDLNHIYDNKEC